MKTAITKKLSTPVFAILALTLFGSMINAAAGDLDLTFSGDGKLLDGITRASENAYDIAIQQDGKIVAVAGFAVARYNPDGSLDPSFGSGGKVFTRTHFSAVSAINVTVKSVAIQPDGKIVGVGESDGRFGLVRLHQDGSLDTSFGGSGVVFTLGSAQVHAYANSVIIQPDGKLIAVGSIRNRNSDHYDGFVLIRYNSDGSLDQSFGNSGIVVTVVGPGRSRAFSAALQPDNKIVAVGGATGSNWDFAAVRYNTDGSVDQSFGNAGRVITSNGPNWDEAQSVAIQSDGKIVAAGFDALDPVGIDQAIVRYNTDGSLDATFGNGGIASAPVSGGGGAGGVLVQPDGKIIATASLAAYFSLVRYTSNGSLDTLFGTGGIVSLQNIGGRSYAAAQQADGRIVAAGNFYDSTGTDLALVRCNTDGSLDPSFDSDGTVRTDFGFFSGNRLYNVATQPDGKIVAAGNPEYSVIRYNFDGSKDTSFNGVGHSTIGAWGTNGGLDVAVAVQPDGKTVAAGIAYYGDMYDMGFDVIRYNSDGTPDTAFGDGGRVNLFPATAGDWSDAAWVHIWPDGKIIAGGGDRIIRLNPNGSLDAGFGGGDGVANAPAYAYASAIQPNGKIVIAGPIWNNSINNSTHHLVVARLDQDGAPDSTFGSGGVATIPVGISISREIVARTVAIQTDGKILAGGHRLVRFNENGSLDIGFGNNGIVTPPMESFREVVIESDGQLVIAGSSNNDFAIARYNTNGSLDTSFGGGDGIATVDFNNSNDTAYGMTLDAQGRAVVVGESSGAFAIARILLATPSAPFDYDGDGRSDISVFRPTDRVWYLNQSTNGFSATQFGLSTDKITPADYDGDGKTDISVYRDGTWYWLNSADNSFNARQFGLASDIPVPADYHAGDGRAELAVYRNGTWITYNLANGQSQSFQFGLPNDKPVPADYDGDGRVDYAVYRDGLWYLQRSTQGFAAIPFGLPTDRLVPADYDGDGRADIAVYRDGTWYLLRSLDGLTAFQFGISTDAPTPADYDGDGKTDAAVYRNGVWYLRQSTGGFAAQQFGLANDRPVPAVFTN